MSLRNQENPQTFKIVSCVMTLTFQDMPLRSVLQHPCAIYHTHFATLPHHSEKSRWGFTTAATANKLVNFLHYTAIRDASIGRDAIVYRGLVVRLESLDTRLGFVTRLQTNKGTRVRYVRDCETYLRLRRELFLRQQSRGYVDRRVSSLEESLRTRGKLIVS